MKAMLAAAAGPLRKSVGNVQNAEGKAYKAMVATENAATASPKWFPAHWLHASATPTVRIGTAACHLRSPVLSECQLEMSIAGTATNHGIPEIDRKSAVQGKSVD